MDETRRSVGRKRLTADERTQCCRKEHPTSICDLLYRMRLRSNYGDPDMYVFADNQEVAKRQYDDTLYVTRMLLAGLDVIMERRIGRSAMQAVTRDSAM